MVTIVSTRQIAKDDDRWIADGCVMPGELQATRLVINLEDSNVVASLVAAVQELPSGIEIETARIIASRPFFPHECQFAVSSDRENANAVVQSIPGVNILSVGRDQDL